VVDARGAAVSGVTVISATCVLVAPQPWSARDLPLRLYGERVVTAADGRFRFDALATERLSFSLVGADLVATDVVGPFEAGRELRFEVHRRRVLRFVDAPAPTAVDRFGVRDADGAELVAEEPSRRLPPAVVFSLDVLADRTLAVPDHAVEVAWYQDDQLLAVTPLAFAADGATLVHVPVLPTSSR
jgi:hypothetical protein